MPIPLGHGGFFVIIIPDGDSEADVIRNAHRKRFKCSSARVRKIGRGRYLATGCGPDRTYTCRHSTCRQDEPDFNQSPARALVERMHKQAYGCKVLSVWYVQPGFYEARGCEPRKLYYCGIDRIEGLVVCKPYVRGDQLPPAYGSSPPPKREAPASRRRWR